MDDRFIKYTKLFALSFLFFLFIPLCIAIVLGAFYGFAGLITSKPADTVFAIFIICLPVAVFSTVYYIFFRRTAHHPVKAIRVISYTIFVLAFLIGLLYLVRDLIIFFNKHYFDIGHYHSFSLLFTAGNVGLLFLMAIIQAFTTSKEKDWMDRDS